jgi:rRNA maturation protein Nop10
MIPSIEDKVAPQLGGEIKYIIPPDFGNTDKNGRYSAVLQAEKEKKKKGKEALQ